MMLGKVAAAFAFTLFFRGAFATFPRPALYSARSVPFQAQQLQTLVQKKHFLRFLEDQQGAGATVKYDSCYTDYKGRDLVKFHLCPAGSTCDGSCQASSFYYVTNIKIFLSSIFGTDNENQDNEENDYYQGAQQDDDQNNCVEGGDDDCGSASFDPSLYLKCAAYDEKFYVGPYCEDGQVYLGYYWDEDCSTILDDSFYHGLYGYALEYSALSGIALVNETNACATCGDVDADGVDDAVENDNEEQQDENNQDENNQVCRSLLSYSVPLWKDNVEEEGQNVTANKATFISLVVVLVAFFAAAVVMGSFFLVCYTLLSFLQKKDAKAEALLHDLPKTLPVVQEATSEESAILSSAAAVISTLPNAERSPSDDESINSLGSQAGNSILVSKADSA